MRMSRKPESVQHRLEILCSLCDGVRSSSEIQKLMTEELGYPVPNSYVVNTALKLNLPRLPQVNLLKGKNAPAFVCGKQLNDAGYVLALAPENHPYQRKNGTVLEHRLVLEQNIGRYIHPTEVVHHIDGLHLHNAPENLHLFANSSEHTRSTLAGKAPRLSRRGKINVLERNLCHSDGQRVSIYNRMRESGDFRRMQILLAALKLGIDSPFVSYTLHHLAKVGIVDFSDSSLKRALADLSQRYA